MFARHVHTRRTEALEIRKEAAELAFRRPHPQHISNGEEGQYRRPFPPPPSANNGELSYVANYSKGLLHNSLGEVIQKDYRRLLRALYSGNPDHFEQIPLGTPNTGRKLTNPQAGLA